VTALNLLPAAQLDGGHIAYALFPKYHQWISRIVVAALIPLAIFYWPVWGIWIVLLFVLKLYHPPTVADWYPSNHAILSWDSSAWLTDPLFHARTVHFLERKSVSDYLCTKFARRANLVHK
jgi:Zn-dependent protease